MNGSPRIQVRMKEPLSSGGEGRIMKTDREDIVIKVFFPKRVDVIEKEKKVTQLISKGLTNEHVCMPLGRLYKNSQFIGFPQKFISDSHCIGELLHGKRSTMLHPSITKISTATLCLNILTILKDIYRYNILIGDINGGNILFKDDLSVYFVDMDSVQVDQYLCSVTTESFLHPDLHHQDLSVTPRTMIHEEFALAVLIFNLLFLGQHPYTHKGNDSVYDNIEKRMFPYTKQNRALIPIGYYERLWLELTKEMKNLFSTAFCTDTRITIDSWMFYLTRYRKDLERKKCRVRYDI